MEGLDRRGQVIIGLQGQYDISVSLSGTRSYICLAMRVDHGDFRPTPVNGHSTEMKLLTEYLERAVSLERLAANEQESRFKRELLHQAEAYRKLAAKRAADYGLPPPPRPKF